MTRLAFPALLLFSAGPALAHSGAHLHPHDGASWLTVAGGLGMMAVAAGLALNRIRAKVRT